MKRGKPLARKTPLQARKGIRRGKGPQSGVIKPQQAIFGVSGPKSAPPRPRKRAKKAKAALAWEIAHLKAVKALACRSCGAGGPNDAHHCFHDRATKFGGRKAPHRWTIPLCKSCHQDGPNAIHRIKRTWRKKHGADHEHVPAVMLAIYGRENPSDSEIETHWKERKVIECAMSLLKT